MSLHISSSAPQRTPSFALDQGLGDETQRLIDTYNRCSSTCGHGLRHVRHRRGDHKQVWIAGHRDHAISQLIRAFPTEQPWSSTSTSTTRCVPKTGLFLDEIRTAAAHYPTFRPHITYSKREGSLTMEQIAASCRGPLSEREVYMCGPSRMIQISSKHSERVVCILSHPL